jgi:hypothetical protein
LYTSDGNERLPIEMDDIYSESWNGNVHPFIKNGKFGFLFEDGSRTEAIYDAFDERDGLLYELVCLNGRWGYLDKELQFTTKRSHAYVGSGLAICHSVIPHDIKSKDDESLSSVGNPDVYKGVSFWMEDVNSKEGIMTFEIGLDQPILYCSFKKETLAIDMHKPYHLDLLNDEERFIKTWDDYENEKEFIKQWLNQKNEKTRDFLSFNKERLLR